VIQSLILYKYMWEWNFSIFNHVPKDWFPFKLFMLAKLTLNQNSNFNQFLNIKDNRTWNNFTYCLYILDNVCIISSKLSKVFTYINSERSESKMTLQQILNPPLKAYVLSKKYIRFFLHAISVAYRISLQELN